MVAPIVGAAAKQAAQAAASATASATVDAVKRRRDLKRYEKLRGTKAWADVPADIRAELDADRMVPGDVNEGIAARRTQHRRPAEREQRGGTGGRGRRSAQANPDQPLPEDRPQPKKKRASKARPKKAGASRTTRAKASAGRTARRTGRAAAGDIRRGARQATAPIHSGTANAARVAVYALALVALMALLRAPTAAARLLEAPGRWLEWFGDPTTGVPYGPSI
jgi:hypothetical protein